MIGASSFFHSSSFCQIEIADLSFSSCLLNLFLLSPNLRIFCLGGLWLELPHFSILRHFVKSRLLIYLFRLLCLIYFFYHLISVNMGFEQKMVACVRLFVYLHCNVIAYTTQWYVKWVRDVYNIFFHAALNLVGRYPWKIGFHGA